MSTVPSLFKQCVASFNSLISSETLASHEEEIPIRDWTDALGRLRVWAGNIGAHQTGQSSLEHRLRDASHIRSQTVKLLERLIELLSDLEEVLEEKDPDDIDQGELPEWLGKVPDDFNEITEIQQIYKSVTETITNLFKLSMVIRKPFQHDRLMGTSRLDADTFKFWAQQHISHKFPQADDAVSRQLSSTMAMQRAIFKYRERHHAKLSHGVDADQNDGRTFQLSETVVSTTFQESEDFKDAGSEAGVSETSYAATLLTGEGTMTIPPMPKEAANRAPFECPYCFLIITLRDNRDWARHIFRDLMPYVCIFPGCPTPNKMYESRRQWFSHIRSSHDLPSNEGLKCSICQDTSISERIFERHVGRHLEELALFVLPRLPSEEAELESLGVPETWRQLEDPDLQGSDSERDEVKSEGYFYNNNERGVDSINSMPMTDDDNFARWYVQSPGSGFHENSETDPNPVTLGDVVVTPETSANLQARWGPPFGRHSDQWLFGSGASTANDRREDDAGDQAIRYYHPDQNPGAPFPVPGQVVGPGYVVQGPLPRPMSVGTPFDPISSQNDGGNLGHGMHPEAGQSESHSVQSVQSHPSHFEPETAIPSNNESVRKTPFRRLVDKIGRRDKLLDLPDYRSFPEIPSEYTHSASPGQSEKSHDPASSGTSIVPEPRNDNSQMGLEEIESELEFLRKMKGSSRRR